MKALTAITVLLLTTALSAQPKDFRIRVARNMSVNNAMQLGTSVIRFDNSASHFNDASDVTYAVSDSGLVYPFTTDSSGVHLFAVDARPELRSTLRVPFGVWDAQGDEIFIQGAWDNSNLSPLYTVSLVDNATGAVYNAYNEVSFSLSASTNFSEQFTLVFTPKLSIITFDESCFGSANGSLHLRSPESNWELKLSNGITVLNNYAVGGTDTFINNMAAGSYTLIYSLDGQVIDSVNALISGPAPVISSASPSSFTVFENELVSFNNLSTGSVEYNWDFGDGQVSTDTFPSHSYSAAGQYSVMLIVYNIIGCSDTSNYTIYVTPDLFQVNQLAETNSRGNNIEETMSKVMCQSEGGQASVLINSNVKIESVTVYNTMGQTIYLGNTDASQRFTYPIAGNYIVSITYVDGTVVTRQIFLN